MMLKRWGDWSRLMAMASLAVWLCACNANVLTIDPEHEAQQLQPEILNADEYRQEITTIDRLVFQEGPFDDARRNSLVTQLDLLAQRVAKAKESRFLRIEADELERLAAMSDRLYRNESRASLANQWMRIRNNLFDDRSWFARSSADLTGGN